MTISLALTWILFLALFPIAFYWLRRAYRIIVKREFSEVALKGGLPPPNASKYAPYTAVTNLVAGLVIVGTILLIVTGSVDYDTWSAIAGSTIWMKFIFDFIISRHARPIWGKKEDKTAAD